MIHQPDTFWLKLFAMAFIGLIVQLAVNYLVTVNYILPYAGRFEIAVTAALN